MLDDELVAVFENIAEALFAAPIARLARDRARFSTDALVARIHFHGDFEGELSATMERKLARVLATLMMQELAGRCDDDDARDAAGELANIAGGNLRGLLPAQCELSLPDVSSPSLQTEATPILSRADFLLFQEPLSIELRGAAKSSA